MQTSFTSAVVAVHSQLSLDLKKELELKLKLKLGLKVFSDNCDHIQSNSCLRQKPLPSSSDLQKPKLYRAPK